MSENYKWSLQMPQTAFAMRANLKQTEPKWQAFWHDINLIPELLKQNKNGKKYILHSGPPYANGNFHVGHGLNNILKDIKIRYESTCGHYAPFIPTWDTHGLPIETAVLKQKTAVFNQSDPLAFRKLCKQYALNQIKQQQSQ